MEHFDAPQFFGLLVVMLGAAKLFGLLAERLGQPAVVGELLAGVAVGISGLGLVNPNAEVVHLLAELGVVILLFAIGLETDLERLVRVGGTAAVVGLVGVILPFALGYTACRGFGLANLPAIVAGAALTATSVGITARVLADLGQLQQPEGRIVLGAAVLDDVIGLVVLTVVAGVAGGDALTIGRVGWVVGQAVGFLAVVLILGRLAVPPLFRRLVDPEAPVVPAMLLALGLAWLAHRAGSAPILGAFAAGALLHGTAVTCKIEAGVTGLGRLFVPIFFVAVGAAVDVRAFTGPTLLIGGVLTVAAVVGKVVAGFAPFWFRGRKLLIGVGMVPRGEVGLIFAQMGLNSKVFDAKLFGAVTLMVFVTTFLAPPFLKWLAPPPSEGPPSADHAGIDELVSEA